MSDWFKKHPLLRDVLIWSVPALIFGAILRILYIHSSPYAFFGADSRSFMGFTNGALTDFYFSINEKRRYFYPLFLFPISLLPGGTLRWLAVIQAVLGLLSLLPIAYMARRLFTTWKWTIIPITMLLAGMPALLWYEHELIADPIFFMCMNWALGGWVAWTIQKDKNRARRLWWWFWVPFAILILTKPSGKLLWPGVMFGLVLVGSWRVLKWKEWTAFGALFLAGLTVGDDNQSSWLLYTTAFPLTRLDTPLHAEYKAEIRDWVQQKRDRISSYNKEDDEVHDFLRSPGDFPQYTLWTNLKKKERDKLYKELAMEGIKARPDLFAFIALQRLAGSCNQADFKTMRFNPTYYAQSFDEQYDGPTEKSMLRISFGIPKDVPFPSLEEMKMLVSPQPDAFSAQFLRPYADWYQAKGDLINREAGHITLLGWLLLLGATLSLIPPFLKPLGIWSLAFGGYLFAVFLIGIENHRYFTLVWPFVLILLALIPEMILRSIQKLRSRA